MGSRLDVVLINPGAQQQVYQGLSSDGLTAIEPPVWVGLLATFARNHGLSVQIVDAEAEGFDPDAVGRRVAELDPRIAMVVAFGSQPSASTQKMTAAGLSCGAIRQHAPGTRTMLGGVHVSALPERTLAEEPVDFVCEGEGPYTLLHLVEALKGERELVSVPGLWYREGGEVHHNAPAQLIQDLDAELPGVAWDLLPMARYRAHNWHCFGRLHERQPYAVIYTSLGCPFRCSFCCINAPFGSPGIRYRSPKSVVDELELLQRTYGVKTIKILDEMFVLNPKHVLEICDLILERGLAFNFWAYARVDTVRDFMLEKMKAAGFNWLALGIESGSRHVRDGVEKGRFGSEQIVRVVQAIQAAGIHVIGNYIFGLPDDDHQSMTETLELAMELNCEMANFYSAMAYPGSKLYGMAVEKGWALPERWHGFSQHAIDTLPLPTEHVSAGHVLGFRDQAFHVYFGNPRYLASVEAKFGRETRQHIEALIEKRLVRRFAEPVQIQVRQPAGVQG